MSIETYGKVDSAVVDDCVGDASKSIGLVKYTTFTGVGGVEWWAEARTAHLVLAIVLALGGLDAQRRRGLGTDGILLLKSRVRRVLIVRLWVLICDACARARTASKRVANGGHDGSRMAGIWERRLGKRNEQPQAIDRRTQAGGLGPDKCVVSIREVQVKFQRKCLGLFSRFEGDAGTVDKEIDQWTRGRRGGVGWIDGMVMNYMGDC